MSSKEINHITANNSALANNSVYAFGKSCRNIFWIGGDGPGLNYYSYRDKIIKRLAPSVHSPALAFEPQYIHAIEEVNDSVLWLASVGAGIFKLTLAGSDDEPVIKSIKRFTFVNDEMPYNYFFAACRENDSILWFGNRGYGLKRLNLLNETFDNVVFTKKDIHTINDIFSIYRDSRKNIWVGTSFGILKLLNYNTETHEVFYENYNEIEGLPNNTIHGILEDENGFLWLSTNGGVVRFDAKTNGFHVYNHKSGLSVFEFSDGAYLKDELSGALLFGGINGFVTIAPDIYTKKNFVPELFFTGLKIYENEYNINDFLKTANGREYLQLEYEQNFFSVSFVALEYINGQNCKYYYNLENFNHKWIENAHSNVANFANISPGEYTLYIRCNNGDLTTDIRSLTIVILPPWYRTAWAYMLYAILIMMSLWLMIQLVRRRYKRKRENIIEKMKQRQKEEIYESKLRFFTNITHEFSTPLTLIYGPCDRIISYENSDSFVKKYAGMIMRNAERLNLLIQELIEFRRIETGHKTCVIEHLDITELADSIADSFLEMAEVKKINYLIDIKRDIQWNSDKGCFVKILTNLLSNAFKYTPDDGKITLAVYMEDGLLQILVANTGKGIKEKDIPYVFDRYRILENFEEQTRKGIFSRNGLGLAICYNMVKLLDGKIDVRSVPGEITEFHVTLPFGEITNIENQIAHNEHVAVSTDLLTEKTHAEQINYTVERSKPTIFVIDDDPEICWFISEIFNKQYNVVSIEDPLSVLEKLKNVQPHLIISDIMMNGRDGISLMKQIKSDRRTAHIPFILLSAKNTPEEQTEGIAAGAEAYIVKPFNIEYLQSVAGRLLKRQTDLRDYYRSAISAYEFLDGKFIHKENKDFFERLLIAIDKNLINMNFTSEQLAAEMGVSLRQLYRKLKDITNRTPAELIKEYHLAVAEKLLATTRDSVDEIMYKSGFNNRGTFYKIFSLKYGMTPKKYRESKTVELAEM